MHTLIESMNLVTDCLLAWLNPEKNHFPTDGFEVAHDTGRWWDAMLRMEAATGRKIPGWAEESMHANIMALMDNNTGFLLNRPDIEWLKEKAYFNPHNIREAMLALAGLVKFRRDTWAVAKGHELLKSLLNAGNSDGSFDYEKLSILSDMPMRQNKGNVKLDGTSRDGRALEAILLFFHETNDPLAIRVANKIAERHFNLTVNSDGSIPARIISEENIGHNHSYLGTLRGLLKYGIMTGKQEFIDAVSNTYDRSIFVNNVSYAGWAPHDLGKKRFCNDDGDPESDPASCGDAMQIALWLAIECGRTELLDDVERLVKCRLLPQQITADPDPRRNGAWGICGHPYGYGVILDVFAAVLHTLTDVYGNIVTEDKDAININMGFDIETPSVKVIVQDTDRRHTKIRINKKSTLRVRIPGWVNKKTILAQINGAVHQVKVQKGYLEFAEAALTDKCVVDISYDLPVTRTTEKMRISGREFTLTWKGDTVESCFPEVPIYRTGGRNEH